MSDAPNQESDVSSHWLFVGSNAFGPKCRSAELWKNLWTNHPHFVENITLSLERVFVRKWLGDRPWGLFHKFSTGSNPP